MKAIQLEAPKVFRRIDPDLGGFEDMIGLRGEGTPAGSEPLLGPVMRAGRRVEGRGSLDDGRKRFLADLESAPAGGTR